MNDHTPNGAGARRTPTVASLAMANGRQDTGGPRPRTLATERNRSFLDRGTASSPVASLFENLQSNPIEVSKKDLQDELLKGVKEDLRNMVCMLEQDNWMYSQPSRPFRT